MDDLVQFLRTRLDEDHETARKAASSQPGGTFWERDGAEIRAGDGAPVTRHTWAAEGAHIARHDPARVLAEVDAKRRLIAQILRYEAKIDGEWGCCHSGEDIAAGLCEEANPNEIEALRLLALPYAGHLECRDEWRPTSG